MVSLAGGAGPGHGDIAQGPGRQCLGHAQLLDPALVRTELLNSPAWPQYIELTLSALYNRPVRPIALADAKAGAMRRCYALQKAALGRGPDITSWGCHHEKYGWEQKTAASPGHAPEGGEVRSREVLQVRGRIAGEAGEAGGPGGQLAVRLAVGHQQAGRHEAGAHPCQLLALRHHLGQARQGLHMKAVCSQDVKSRTVACMPHRLMTSGGFGR